jgi:hypothetical protein
MSTARANALLTDLDTVDDRIRSGVTAQCAKAMENHWTRWYGLCLELGVDPYLRRWEDPVPLLQVFGERYRNGRLAPLHCRPSSHGGGRPACNRSDVRPTGVP